MKTKESLKRFLAFLLSAAMIVTYMPSPVFTLADESSDEVVSDETKKEDTETKVESKSETKPEAKAETKSETKSETKAEPAAPAQKTEAPAASEEKEEAAPVTEEQKPEQEPAEEQATRGPPETGSADASADQNDNGNDADLASGDDAALNDEGNDQAAGADEALLKAEGEAENEADKAEEEADEEVEYWIVKFHNRDGEVFETRKIRKDAEDRSIGKLPDTIPREDYNSYWAVGSIDDHGTTTIDVPKIDSGYKVNSDISVVPQFEKIEHTITFYKSKADAEAGTGVVATKTVDVDTSYCLNDIPAVPSQSGSSGKWVYSGGDFNNSVAATSDISVWAEYEKQVFDVAFMVDGKVYESDTYYKGDSLELPADPVLEGKDFQGWYILDTKYNGGEAVNSDLTLEGKFTNMNTVSFIVRNDDGTIKETLSQYYRSTGEAIGTMPEDPFVSGKVFEKWVIDGTETEVTAATKVTGDMTVVAQFRKVDVYELNAEYFYINDSGKEVIFNTEIINLETHELPYTVTAPASTQTSAEEVQGGPKYYVQTQSQTAGIDAFDADNKATIRFEYVEYTAEYDYVYMLKNLSGSGYTEIPDSREHVYGVLGSFVTPTAKTFDFAVLESIEGEEITKAEGQELEVYYTRKNFSLSYETNGGSYIAGRTAAYGETVSLSSAAPTRDGYTFAGWYLDEALTQAAGSSVTIEGDTTVYAKWEGAQVNYTIVYMVEKYDDTGTSSSYVYDNSRDGTGKVGTTAYANDAPTLTKTGYEKDNEKNAASSVEIAADGSSVLFVYYKLTEYTINFNRNGRGSIVKPDGSTTTSTYSFTAKIGQDISGLWPSASSSDRYFVGWQKDGQGINYTTKQLIMNTDLTPSSGTSLTFYAHWERNATTRTVNYYMQNADDDGYTKSDTYSQTYSSTGGTLNPKEITGYTYDHSANSGNTYNFYYNRNTYKIDYFYSSTKINTIEKIKFDASINKSPYVWTPTAAQCGVDSDYTFAGWYSDSGLTTQYTFSKMPAANLVLYAKWTAPQFTVSYEMDGGTPAIESQTVTKYSKVTRPSDPTKTGFTFEGWFTTADGTTLYDWANQITSDTTIYAHWTQDPISYTVHYVDEEGNSLSEDKTVTNPAFEEGQEITEHALAIAGYRPDESSKTIELQVGENEITFVYIHKADKANYTVKYILVDGDKQIAIAADKSETVSGDTLKVVEMAIEVPSAFYEEHSEYAGQEFYPDEVEKELTLGADDSKNIITFYYSKYQSAKVTVNFVDMDGNSIADAYTETLKVGKTYTLGRTPISGWELNKAVEGTAYSGAAAGSSYKITSAEPLVFTLFYQKKVTVTANSFSKQYDGEALEMPAALADQVAAEGLLEGDSLTSVKLNYANADAADGKGRLDAGTATVTPSAASISGKGENSNYYKVRYISGTLEVTKINVTVRIEPDRWTGIIYDGTAKKVGFTNGTKTDPADYIMISHEGYADSYLNDIWNVVKTKATYDASTPGLSYYVVSETNVCDKEYDLGITLEDLPENDNYSVSLYVRKGRVQILPREATVTTGSDSKAYDGTPLTKDEASIEGLAEADEGKVTVTATGSQTEVGTSENTYTINWGDVSSDNYTVDEELGSLEVTRASLTVSVEDDELPYNGELQTGAAEYTVEGLADGHTLTVAYTPAQGTDVGSDYEGSFASTFTITDKSGKDVSSQYGDPEFVPGKLEITPLEVTVTITGNKDSKPYSGAEQSVEGYEVEISDELYTEDDFTFSGEAVAKGTDVDAYPMGLAEDQFTNNNDNFSVTFSVTDGELEITPLAVTVTITGNTDSKPYTGAEQKVEGYEVEISNELYTENDFTFSGEAVAKGTDADTYPMGLAEDQFINNNENFEVTFSVTDGQLLITKADMVVTITGNKDSKVYTGAEQKVEGYEVTLPEGADFTKDDIVFSGEAVAKGTDVDTYSMGLTKDQFSVESSNYDVDFLVTDGQLQITPLAVTVEIEGNKDSKVYSGLEQKAEGYEVKSISSALYTEDDFTFSGSAVAKGTDVDTYPMGLSKDQFTNNNDNFSVTFSVTDGELEITPLAVTVTITGSKDSKVYAGAEQSVDGYTVEISNDLYTEDDFRFTGEAVAKGTDVNKYPMGLTEEQFVNDNDNFDVTFSITDGELEITKRTVTLTSATDRKVYDGKALTNDKVTVSGDGFVEGEGAAYVVSGSQTLVGHSKNTFTYTLNEGTKADNYTITKEEGTLTVTDGEDPDDPKEVDDDLVVTKTATDKKYALGEVVTFNITATNIYDEARTISLTEIEGVELAEESKSVAAGGKFTTTATYTITEADILNGSFTNTVTAEVGKITKQAEATVRTEDAKAAIEVTKTSDVPEGTKVDLGDVINYTVTVKNTGNVTVKDIEISDTLVTVEEAAFDLAPGKSKEISYSYTVTEEDIHNGKVVNHATAKGDKTEDDDEIEIPTADENPKLEVKKTSDVPEGTKVDLGDVINYTVTVENTGNVTVKDIEISDTLVTIEEEKFDLAPGEKKEISYSYTVTEEDIHNGKVVNHATAKGDKTEDDDEIEIPTADENPKLEVEKTSDVPEGTKVDLNDVINYTVTVENTGNVTVKDIEISDTLVTVEEAAFDLAPGEKKEISYSYTVTEEDIHNGKVVNHATAKGDKTEDDDEIEIPTADENPKLEVEKTSDVTAGAKVDLGDVINYTVTVKNTGNVTVKGIEITDTLVTVEEAAFDLAPGKSKEIKYSYTVTEEDILNGKVVNHATAKGDKTEDDDEIEIPTVDPNGHITINKVSTSKPANGRAYVLGEKITYRITAANDGNITITNVVVKDELTGDKWTFDSLAPNASRSFTANHTVTAADVAAGKVVNEATAEGISPDPENPKPTVEPDDDTVKTEKLAITITAASARKVYDGTALTAPRYTQTAGKLASGDRISTVTVTGKRTAVGSSRNVPSNAKIVNASGADVTAAYTITYVNGRLTVTAAPAPAPTPRGGGNPTVTPGGPAAPTPAPEVEPEVIPDEPTPEAEPEEIPDAPTPMAGGVWALINLISAILTTLGAAIALFRKKDDDDEDEDEENKDKAEDENEDEEEDNRGKKMLAAKIAGAIAGVAAPITFILTEDMSLPMALVDKWTVLMLVMLAAQIVAAVLNKKASEKKDDEEAEEQAQQA